MGNGKGEISKEEHGKDTCSDAIVAVCCIVLRQRLIRSVRAGMSPARYPCLHDCNVDNCDGKEEKRQNIRKAP